MFTSDCSGVTQVTSGQETTKTKTHPTGRHGTLPLETQDLSKVGLAMSNTEDNSKVSFLGGGSHKVPNGQALCPALVPHLPQR